MESAKYLKQQTWMRSAERLFLKGEIEQALSFTRKILALDVSHLGALEIEAKALWSIKKMDRLKTVLDRLICVNPYEPGYHELRGAVYAFDGLISEAIRSFERAQTGASQEAIIELIDLQHSQIQKMIQQDESFRIAYGQNPMKACLNYGFYLVPTPNVAAESGRSPLRLFGNLLTC